MIETEMTSEDVLDVLNLFEQHHLEVIVDGGWGVDALLGEQTRPHSDLDIAMPHPNVPLARQLLEARGYRDVPRPDTRDCNFVLGDDEGHQVDFHSYIFDEAGNLLFGVPYPLDSLEGRGFIGGRPVKCITPARMVEFHTGYPLDENDYRDVKALCERYSLKLPLDYAVFEQKQGQSKFIDLG